MAQNAQNIKFIGDVQLDISVELGRTRKLFKDILKLKKDDVISLPTKTGDRIDFFVNNKLIAKGEVMVIQGKFALRITDIVGNVEKAAKAGAGV